MKTKFYDNSHDLVHSDISTKPMRILATMFILLAAFQPLAAVAGVPFCPDCASATRKPRLVFARRRFIPHKQGA